MIPRHAAPLLLCLALTAAPMAGQEIAGVALDVSDHPLAGIPVALHRVGGGSGATVAASTTDDEGRFRFGIEVVDSAVYFVAMRHDDRLYIGPPARGGAERVTDYVIRADPGSEAGVVASALSGGRASPAAAPARAPAAGVADGAVWLVALLALAVAVVFVTTAPGYRLRRRRELLVDLARVEDRLAAAEPGADPTADLRRRSALRERLAPRS